jgi:hypothetical protein
VGVDQELKIGDSSPKRKIATKENNNLVESSSQKATKYRKLITEVNEKI